LNQKHHISSSNNANSDRPEGAVVHLNGQLG
jgi:hypothetical protein